MYYKNVTNKSVTDAKKLWETIGDIFDRNKKKKNASNIIKFDNKTVNISEEPIICANIFNKYFSMIGAQ